MTFSNDGRGNVASVTDPNGHTVTASYDWGVMASTTSAAGLSVTRTLNDDASVAAVSVGGATTSFAYDTLGRVTSVTPPMGAAKNTSYSGTTITASRGGLSAVTQIDGFGRTLSTTVDPGYSNPAIHTRVAYDAAGRATYQSYPSGTSDVGDTVTYDALGRTTGVTHSDGTHASVAYYNWGRHVVDENFKATDYALAAFGHPSSARLTDVTDARGANWHYTYNAFGSLTRVDAPVGPARTWTYSSANRLTADTQPESGTTSYPTYDAAGNLIQRIDARGVAFQYGYDADNRLTGIGGIGAESVGMVYDARGNLTTLSSANYSSTFGYDTAGRLTTRTDLVVRPAQPSHPYAFVTTFAYDDLDNLTLIHYPSGREVRYDYDHAGRVRAVRDRPSSGATDRYLAQYATYAPTGGLTGVSYGNGTWEAATFTARGQVSHLQSLKPNGGSSQAFLDLTYAYNNVGNMDWLVNAVTGTSSVYQYDEINRLVGVTGTGAMGFSYDSVGNRITKANAAGTVAYSYDTNTQRLMSSTTPEATTYAYDAVGTMTREGPWWYTPTATNQIGVVRFGSDANGPVIATYGYDGSGQRVEKNDGDGRHLYIRGPGGLLAEYLIRVADGEPSLEREYVYMGGRLLASINGASPTLLTVAITTPTNGQSIGGGSTGATVTLQASVSAPAGLMVSRVEYYQAGFKIGESTAAPYSVNWSNLPYGPGTFQFTARVVTTDGHAAGSTSIFVNITAHEPAAFPSPPLDTSASPSALDRDRSRRPR